MEIYNLAKGNETCCHICTKCQNPCPSRGTCTGACGSCPHPCWVDWKQYGRTWKLRETK